MKATRMRLWHRWVNRSICFWSAGSKTGSWSYCAKFLLHTPAISPAWTSSTRFASRQAARSIRRKFWNPWQRSSANQDSGPRQKRLSANFSLATPVILPGKHCFNKRWSNRGKRRFRKLRRKRRRQPYPRRSRLHLKRSRRKARQRSTHHPRQSPLEFPPQPSRLPPQLKSIFWLSGKPFQKLARLRPRKPPRFLRILVTRKLRSGFTWITDSLLKPARPSKLWKRSTPIILKWPNFARV